MPIYKANDLYAAQLRAAWVSDPADGTLAVNAIPANFPTLVTAAKGLATEATFEVTGYSGTSSSDYTLTGVTWKKGYTGDQAANSTLNCLNNEEFFNQYADSAVLVDAVQTFTNKTLVTPIVTTAHAIGAGGTSETIDWTNGDLQTMTLDENITINFSNAVAGQRLTLFLLQDGTGTNTITWTPTITWQDGITWGPLYYSTAANKMNVVVIYYSGSAYFGMVAKFA